MDNDALFVSKLVSMLHLLIFELFEFDKIIKDSLLASKIFSNDSLGADFYNSTLEVIIKKIHPILPSQDGMASACRIMSSISSIV